MVMDIWQASLLRALAKQQLRQAASSLDEAAAAPTNDSCDTDDVDHDEDGDEMPDRASVSLSGQLSGGSQAQDPAELTAEADPSSEQART